MEQAPPADRAGMEDSVQVRLKTLAQISRLPRALRCVQRHIDDHGRTDDVLARNATPEARIKRILPVVPHCKVTVGRNSVRQNIFLVAESSLVHRGRSRAGRSDCVWLIQPFAVYPHGVLSHVHKIARKSDNAFHKIRLTGFERRLEDYDLLALRIPPKRNVNVGEWNARIVAEPAHDQVIANL